MTVVNYDKFEMGAVESSYLCKWFDEKNKVVQDTFREAEVELATKAASNFEVLRA